MTFQTMQAKAVVAEPLSIYRIRGLSEQGQLRSFVTKAVQHLRFAELQMVGGLEKLRFARNA